MMSRRFIPLFAGILLSLLSAVPSIAGDDDRRSERSAPIDVTLTEPLTVIIDASGNTLTLPAGTLVGRQEIETRLKGNLTRQETELRNITLVEDLSFTHPVTGETVTLPAGTVVRRLDAEQRVDAAGIVVRSEFKLTARAPDGTVIRIGDRPPRDARNVVLTEPLTVTLDAAGNTLILPPGTVIGRQEIETRLKGNLTRQETELRNVTLVEDLSFTNPVTGETISLTAGTVVRRFEVEQRVDAAGNVLRTDFRLKATAPDGTALRIRERVRSGIAPSASGSLERGSSDAAAPRAVRSGSDSGRGGRNAGSGSSGERAAASRVERGNSGRGSERAMAVERTPRVERIQRAERSDRPTAVERPQRPERAERVARVERVERIARAERPERSDRVERAERPDRSGSGNSGRR